MQHVVADQNAQRSDAAAPGSREFRFSGYGGRRILVLGLGESGLAMVRWLTRFGAQVRVADSREHPPGLDQVHDIRPSVDVHCGPFVAALLDDMESVAVSPGVSIHDPLLVEARTRGLEITGEIELFARALETSGERGHCRVIAITGTNGKTTTTTLVGELVRACGMDAGVAGNISPAVLDELLHRIDQRRLPDIWVLELSSFQLETTDSFRADAATVLNVTDDHLDRHGSIANYAAVKARVFHGGGVQVVNVDDAWSRQMRLSGRPHVNFGLEIPERAEDFGIRTIDGVSWMVQGEQALLACRDLPLAGLHNVANALAGLALCHAVGLPMPPMLAALRAFRGLPHRVERIAMRQDGVAFYDDSKGTNVGATLAALQGMGCPVILIAGGDGKGQDFSPLAEGFRHHARAVILIGRDAGLIEDQTRASGTPMLHAKDLPEAVRLANQQALAGDVVLLSPACASMDMFRNYAHRSQVFIEAVRLLPEVQA